MQNCVRGAARAPPLPSSAWRLSAIEHKVSASSSGPCVKWRRSATSQAVPAVRLTELRLHRASGAFGRDLRFGVRAQSVDAPSTSGSSGEASPDPSGAAGPAAAPAPGEAVVEAVYRCPECKLTFSRWKFLVGHFKTSLHWSVPPKGQRALQRKRRACLVPLAKREGLRRVIPDSSTLEGWEPPGDDAGAESGSDEEEEDESSSRAQAGEAARGKR